MPMVWR